jgi:hypothetical protein
MPVVAVGLCRAARESRVVLDVSDEAGQNRMPGGLAAACRIALAERMDSGNRPADRGGNRNPWQEIARAGMVTPLTGIVESIDRC